MQVIKRVKQTIAREVRGIFSDPSRGERPVAKVGDGLFPPGSVVRRVHGDVTTMMIGGIAALLLQMLHPAVLAGVWDHSSFRNDMPGRLRRTARFVALTTYGSKDEAEAALSRVRTIHARIGGKLPSGASYSAADPKLLAWVHVTETMSFLQAWIRYGEPDMSRADQDRYFAETAQIGAALGADPVPCSFSEAEQVIAAMRPELACDQRTREVARLVLFGRPTKLAVAPFQVITMSAAVDLLPSWARRMHGLARPAIARPLIQVGARGLAETLRWAFSPS